MVRKFLFVAVILALISSSFSCRPVKPSISGTYVCTQASQYVEKGYLLELKKDGTIYYHEPGQPGISGEWKVDGDEIMISTEFFGMTWQGKIQGDTIVLMDGSTWVKEREKAATPTPEPPAPTPTLATIPEEILASHFGIGRVGLDTDEIAELSIRWARPLANPSGPFIWGLIERESGKYIWQLTDTYVQKIQGHNMAFLAVIWPFAEWDQANWGPVDDTAPLVYEQWMGRSRRKPYDMDAYRRFVSALVERYDGDGIGDMPGLKYPIEHWQAGFAPSLRESYFTYFDGSSEDYLEVLIATYQAVKEADPEAKVLHATMGFMKPPQVSFWEPIFEKGSQYFDIANIQIVWPLAEFDVGEHTKTELIAIAELTVPGFKELLSKYGIDKPMWVSLAQFDPRADVSPEELGQIFVRSYVISFACGVDKYFYEFFKAFPSDPPFLERCALVDENGKRRPAYYGLKTLIEKLDKFTSAEKLAEGQYKFMVEGKAIYVLWGAGKIPEEITGEVLVTDIYGNETRMNSSAINLTESPIFIEGGR